ncbi:uncharacterized protein LOC111078999 [Drosophila obscura]|uniref:uncharacterized protein LOC111078999 n=1 Tax=Drosophila obscura TaxID=7282 RepID=UPI001BB134F6|nr:uncharacterized protein LOC111078999 [Drosophila obscura]
MRSNQKRAQKRDEELAARSSDCEAEDEDEDALQAALKLTVDIPDCDSQDAIMAGMPQPTKFCMAAERTWSAELQKASPQRASQKERKPPEIAVEKMEATEKVSVLDPKKNWSTELRESLKSWYADLNATQKPTKRPQEAQQTSSESIDNSGGHGAGLQPEVTWSKELRNEQAKERRKEKTSSETEKELLHTKNIASKSVTFVEPGSLMQLQTESNFASRDEQLQSEDLPAERSSSQVFKLTPKTSSEDLDAQMLHQSSRISERGFLNYLHVTEPQELVVPRLSSSIGLERITAELEGKLERIEAASNPKSYKKPKSAASTQTLDAVEAKSEAFAVPAVDSGMVLINVLALPFQQPLANATVDEGSAESPAIPPKSPTPPAPPPPASSVDPNDVKFKDKPANDAAEEEEQQQPPLESKSSLMRSESMRTLTITGRTHIKTQWRDHCHLEAQHEGIDKPARRKLLIACGLCLVFMIAEVIGGILSNSLAIATDAAHLLTDLAGFLISLFALYISARPKTQRLNFGWYRAEVIGAMISVYFIWVITGILVWLAAQRLWAGEHVVDAEIMLITSAVAILFNVIMAIQLNHGHGQSHYEPGEMSRQTRVAHGHSHELQLMEASVSAHPAAENINVRAAMIHVIGDMIQSVGVFVAALIIFFQPAWAFVDAICTFLFSIIVLLVTFRILRDVLMVLMEATPDYMDYEEVQRKFLAIEGVEHVHNLRIWALSINKVALSAHLAIKQDADSQRILEEATTMIHKHYRFFETTIQIEEYTPGMENCAQCITPGGMAVISRVDSRTALAMEEGASSGDAAADANKRRVKKPVNETAKS